MSSSGESAKEERNETFPESLTGEGPTTILAYGALLSERSSRLTFPDLTNFRLVRVRGLRRVFSHPHLFLIAQNVIDPSDLALRLASLSAEKTQSSEPTSPAEEGAGFVVAAFDVDLDDEQRAAFVERERAYNIATVSYYSLDSDYVALPAGKGAICLAGSDSELPQELAPVADRLRLIGRSIWHWEHSSGLLPADIYLRHCLLSVKKAGPIAERSFLEETFLADRTTSLKEYLETDGNADRVMEARPPEALVARFNG